MVHQLSLSGVANLDEYVGNSHGPMVLCGLPITLCGAGRLDEDMGVP